MNQDEQLSIRFVTYSVIGFFVLLFNAISIATFFAHRDRSRFTIYQFLCIAEFINGLNFTVTGICRYIVLGSGHFHEPMTSRQCLFTTPWLIIMIIGETYPASMTLVVSLERFFAVTFMAKFRVWKSNHRKIMVSVGILFPLSMLIAAILNVLFNVQTNADRQCGTTSGINPIYGLTQNTLSVTLYLVAFTICIYVNFTIPSKRTCTKTETRQLKTMIAISTLSLLFVAIPNAVLIENKWGPIKFSDLFQGIAYSLYGIQSCLYFFVFFCLRPEFRQSAKRLLRFRGSVSEVTQSNPNIRAVLPILMASQRKNSQNPCPVKNHRNSITSVNIVVTREPTTQ